MAVSSATELKILVKTAGEQNLTRLSRQLEGVGKNTASAGFKFDKFAASLRRQEQQSTKNISNLRTFAGAWRELANSVDYTSARFKEANREAQRLERQLAKTQRAGRGGGLARAARTGGAIAAAGIFGGPEGALGAGIGAIAGGPVGAAVGGAIGAQVGQFRQQLGATATYAADLQKQRIALAGLTRDYAQYQNALERVERLSQQFQIPQEIITRQFTKLAASVIGAGGSLDDAEKAFKGVASGIRGTGGDLQDLSSALTATAQVFSKGKVSAEELRQQIGERLPGAFTLFAQSLGMTPAELDKALEGGKVSLQDFQKFSELLFDKFGKSSEAIVNGPAAAGERLQVQLSKLSENVGKLLAPIGAAFQNVFTEIIRLINGAVSALNRLFKIDLSGEVENLTAQIRKLEQGPAGEKSPQRQRRLQRLADLRRDLKQATQQRALLSIGAGGGEPPSGLPGAAPAGAAKGKQRKDISTALRDAQLAAIGLYEQIEPLQQIALNREAKLLEIKEKQLLPNERIVAEARVNKEAEEAIQKIVNTTAKDVIKITMARIDGNKAADEAIKKLEIEAGIIDEKQAKQIEKESFIQQLQKNGFVLNEEMLARIDKAYEKLNTKANESKQLAQSIVTTFADGMGDALLNLFDRAKSFRDLLGDILRQVGSLLINFGMKSLTKGLFPDLFRASGGPVNADSPYIVGERGPELFVPRKSGKIVSNKNMKKYMQYFHPLYLAGAAGVGDEQIEKEKLKNANLFHPLNLGRAAGIGSYPTTQNMFQGAPLFHPLNLAFAAGIGSFGSMRGMMDKFPFGGGNLFGGIAGRANGGPVAGGANYLVGEQGPELYVPRIPAKSNGGDIGGIVVNVDATGTSVEGDGLRGDKLGQALGAAVRAELIRQKRPGGLLS